MTIDVSDLIRAFEPILYFADGERFFPSDCKRYLERCALWNAVDPFDQNSSWRKSGPGSFPAPIIQYRQVSGRPDEAGIFLGTLQGGSFPFLYSGGPDDGFLELTGWTDGPAVSVKSQNHFANLDQLEKLYNSASAIDGDSLLNGSRFWYHAEVFDVSRLRLLMMGSGAPANFREFFPTLLEPELGEPLLLCYYLFFPGHDEGLVDCADVADSDKFGSFAGEWACIALLLRNQSTDTPIGGGPAPQKWIPVTIGLTSRNVGDIGFLGGERRLGMRVFDFDLKVQTVPQNRGPAKQQGIHTRLFVAKGTHGLYLKESFLGEAVPFFAPDDAAGQFCGATELLGKSLDDLQSESDANARPWVADPAVVWAKAIVNLLWAGIEWIAGGGGGFDSPGTRTPDQLDHPPQRDAPGYFGMIIHPAGVDPPNGATTKKSAWQFSLTDEARLETKIDGRRYSMLVDRVSADDLVRQVWWPGIQGFSGYSGRWGPRVARDPKARRAGMKFPEFWDMFMTAFVKSKGK
ncbi:MAG TPA: hypothetical protein VF957_02270 [Bradyrhizobium sp.]|jgi:hypothetical protein